LERIIKKLKELKSFTIDEKKNVQINIEICKMQIGIREKYKRYGTKYRK